MDSIILQTKRPYCTPDELYVIYRSLNDLQINLMGDSNPDSSKIKVKLAIETIEKVLHIMGSNMEPHAEQPTQKSEYNIWEETAKISRKDGRYYKDGVDITPADCPHGRYALAYCPECDESTKTCENK